MPAATMLLAAGAATFMPSAAPAAARQAAYPTCTAAAHRFGQPAAPPLHHNSTSHCRSILWWRSIIGCCGPSIRGSALQGRTSCRGYVGEKSQPAGEYHAADFEWEELVEEGRAAVERQRCELRQHLQQQRRGKSSVRRRGEPEPGLEQNDAVMQPGAGVAYVAQAVNWSEGSDGGSQLSSRGGYDSDDSWERFHSQHSQARFFKEKRYLMLEFAVLAVTHPPQHIAEIGCGCGSALLPVLKASPSCRVTGCDISATALQLFRRAANQAGVQPHRINTFVLDAASQDGVAGNRATGTSRAGNSSEGSKEASCVAGDSHVGNAPVECRTAATPGSSPLAGLEADSLLLVFTLSALPPEAHAVALAHAYAALRPGGLLLFRDYGLYDMAQLRFSGSQMLGDGLYRRKEGTLAYFFSREALQVAAAATGFEEVECDYARVQVLNRKSGTSMRRVFIHGVFRKPAQAAGHT